MPELNQESVRELAYQLWEEDGHQHGKDHDYWSAAEALLADEPAETPEDAPVEPSILPALALKLSR